MGRRLSAAEKGKAIATNPSGPPRLRMRAPDFDPSDLIKDNMLTLVGRLTNPREQKMSSVLPYLAKKWNLVSVSSGADMGNGGFQFRFNKEEDIQNVLANRPYQYGRWMIIVQRWEPIISPNFPAQIPFWISLRGIPLHYWHEKIVRNIGLELGELETYEVTRTSARVRVMVDGLKPLIMEAAMDYDSGEESIISLHYENLGNHCSICYRLSHLQSHCPDRPPAPATRQTEPNDLAQYSRPRNTNLPPPTSQESSGPTDYNNRPFQQRVDRHGRPFGSRVSLMSSRPTGPRNKLAPASSQPYEHNKEISSERVEKEYSSPPYTRRKITHREADHDQEDHRGLNRVSPNLQWRVKSPLLNQE
ncbi:hypothetical protein BRARA_D01053, partial [Brassica rapa]